MAGLHGAPHQASRLSVRARCARIAECSATTAGGRLPRLIDLLWQTDELRCGGTDGARQARVVSHYLTQLGVSTVPRLVAEFEDLLVARGVELPPGFRPIALGCWVGGDRDGNPNVTAATTIEAVGSTPNGPSDPLGAGDGTAAES
ncbi:phosphoenolpyruvate carboxylase [Pseudonocardia sp. MCCB 268]|nr:phosphoenolpyruvate carboxylase [Pseudonocardia cytotoxica]